MDTNQQYGYYYRTGQYKGFYQIKKLNYSGITNLTSSDGNQMISRTGKYTEEVLEKIFYKIDLLTQPVETEV